jgi:hypothetical protein
MKKILTASIIGLTLIMSGCATNNRGQVESVGCDTDTNLGGAAIGAVGGALVGSLIGGGTGNTLATIAGAGAGGYAGSKTRIGCK